MKRIPDRTFQLIALGGLALAGAGCGRSELFPLQDGETATDASTDAAETPDAQSFVPDAQAMAPDAEAGTPDAQPTSCPEFPPIPPDVPPPLGAACTFSSAATSTTPVFATFVGQDLIGLTPQATWTPLFHFGADASGGTTASLSVVSRGDFLGALVAAYSSTSQALDVEFVLLRLDGTTLLHHRETLSQVTDEGGTFGVTGNAAGTFAFSAGMIPVADVWLALADGTLLGPATDTALAFTTVAEQPSVVEPDEKGRLLVTASPNTDPASDWLDFCSGTQTPSTLQMFGSGGAAWGAKLFGITQAGQLATETADGLTILPHPPLPTSPGGFWDFVPPGVAMFSVPPSAGMPMNPNGDLLVVDATTLASHPVALTYPAGLSVDPPESYLGNYGVSSNPAGFGLDSLGNVTMFLSDGSSAAQFETTADGSDWTSVGNAVESDPAYSAQLTLQAIEAGGTYFVTGIGGPSAVPVFQIVRPASGTNVTAPGLPVHIARDGGCVASLASPSEVDIVNATTGATTKVTLPSPLSQSTFENATWSATWVPGDDAVLSFEP